MTHVWPWLKLPLAKLSGLAAGDWISPRQHENLADQLIGDLRDSCIQTFCKKNNLGRARPTKAWGDIAHFILSNTLLQLRITFSMDKPTQRVRRSSEKVFPRCIVTEGRPDNGQLRQTCPIYNCLYSQYSAITVSTHGTGTFGLCSLPSWFRCRGVFESKHVGADYIFVTAKDRLVLDQIVSAGEVLLWTLLK